MRPAFRAACVLALLAFAASGAGMARAASPEPVPTVGGRLAAVGNEVTVEAQGSLPAQVTLSAEAVTLSETTFDLAPSESRTVTFTGDPVGRVYATFAVRHVADAADSNSLTLSVGLKPYVPPFDPTVPGGIGLIALALIAIARRLRLHELRLTRAA